MSEIQPITGRSYMRHPYWQSVLVVDKFRNLLCYAPVAELDPFGLSLTSILLRLVYG
jgi:hypothetical protein